MSFQVEKLEKSMAKLTIETSADEFEKAIEKAYQKNKGKMDVQGFRKGKAPRTIIEKMYGSGVFYEDAANEIIPDAYEKAANESELDIVSRPEIDVVQIEKGKPFIFTAEFAIKPEVTLGDYKGIEVEVEELEVTEEEIMAKIDHEREHNARMISIDNRAIEDGDIVTIDFEGFVDGEAFEGGKGEDYALTIGSHSFVDNFEEQLIGKKIGEEIEVNVTFPENYQAKELEGKPALFNVVIKEIKVKELPELDDDFAQDVSEFDTLDEYKESVKNSINESKEKDAKVAKENKVVDKIIENATMEIPDPMLDFQVNQMAEEFSQRLQSQGLSVQQYFQFTGMDANKFLADLKPQALKRIHSRLVLEAIAKAENIEASDEELNEEINKMAAMYQMEADKLMEIIGDKEKDQLREDIVVQKAVDFVADHAKEVSIK